MAPFAQMVTIGVVVKPQGRRGEVAVEPTTDDPERFPGLRRAWLPGPGEGGHPVEVTSCFAHKGRYVLKLAGVDSIDEAERLRGQDLRIPEEDLPALPEGSYYHHQLRGLRVEDARGAALGVVADVLEAGSAPVLVVRGEAGETLVPLVAEFLREVDLAGGRLAVSIPETVE
jgi:16S rRNA processing protein RimM